MAKLTRISGKGDENSDQQFENDLAKIESGELTKIYPILKPGDWVGLKAGCLYKRYLGSEDAPMVVMGFGYNAPSNFVFLMPNDRPGKNSEEVFAEALQNLNELPQEFEEMPLMGTKMLLASGQDFSSEKILCKQHMQKAQELLGAEEILVSVARRRCLMIISSKIKYGELQMFIALHNKIWEDDSQGNAPILNALLYYVDGKLDSLMPLDN